ncbi:Alpha/Beta hydrolase protein [Boeremia exigua]|uniref:Alpha/Beta hydrolase protein n=1 Tax=Boeremia exigua TaxID=749465 RepID=UPI001E8DCF26|nr:Alpha/Beta hydrolase protein [Boeremia exigua]KAH6629192.1 Alpha/Beta hydrolase protein [Boeremia exigua]
MLNLALSSVAVLAAVAFAQERCDAPYPTVFCNTTEILALKSDDCSPYHVFIVRGSDEPYPGRVGNLTSEICKQIGKDDCTYEDVEYPAKSTAWGQDEWCKSASKGAVNGQAQVKAYAEKCSDSKLILLGLSQGASVAQDILGGGGGDVFECTQDINEAIDPSTSPGSQIVAAVTFGAVARNKDQNFTVGEGVKFDGTRARTPEQLKALQKYSSVLLDYCHYGDPICAVGSEPVNVTSHLDYFFEHNPEVAQWVVGKAKGKAVSVPGSAHIGNVEASQTASASGTSGSTDSTGAGSVVSAGTFVASFAVVLGATLFSIVLL